VRQFGGGSAESVRFDQEGAGFDVSLVDPPDSLGIDKVHLFRKEGRAPAGLGQHGPHAPIEHDNRFFLTQP
jgi:hypothetical protein